MKFSPPTFSKVVLPSLSLFAAALLAACGAQRGSSSSSDSSPSSAAATTQASPAASPEETLPKIVAFGDSLTAGYGLSPNQSYPALLQKMLDADGFKYEVVN